MYEQSSRKRAEPDLPAIIDKLREGEDGPIAAVVVYGLSGLNASGVEQVETVWPELSTDYRRKLLRRLVDAAEANFELEYGGFGGLALADPDPEVRASAIDLLFEDMRLELMDRLAQMAQWDDAPAVRAAAASALGRFILAGELGDLPESETTRAQDVAAALWNDEDEDLDVRRRALESLANCGHPLVPEAIADAYNSGEHRLQVSALYAMGRTYDERWHAIVLREMNNADSEIRFEAARAAGELGIPAAVPRLIRLAQENDREVMEVAIWSLGEIGGPDGTRALTALANRADENGDEDLIEAIEDALASAQLAADIDSLDMDDIDDPDDWDDDVDPPDRRLH